MYIFINEQSIIPYDGEPLKRMVGKRTVQTISNPTDEILLQWGYMPLVTVEIPTYDEETQYTNKSYTVENNEIHEHYEVMDIEVPQEEENATNI